MKAGCQQTWREMKLGSTGEAQRHVNAILGIPGNPASSVGSEWILSFERGQEQPASLHIHRQLSPVRKGAYSPLWTVDLGKIKKERKKETLTNCGG